MSFEVPATAYDQFMGRFATPLAALFAELIGVRTGQSALDVGCGPGALTEQLAARLGASAVAAIDPSRSFVEAIRERLPEVDVRCGAAEQLPFADDSFDLAVAQLVVHFMADPVAGISEMARVTRPGGVVAACVWDQVPGGGPLGPFWQAAHDVDPDVADESGRAGTREGQLIVIFQEAGLQQVQPAQLTVNVEMASFAGWWEPFTMGVGPAGKYVESLGAQRRNALRDRCAELLPDEPFAIEASAWAAVGRA
ncbi:MAG TPA: methyltransferase domain-containing protein [Frankiaceae bacterium]|nr:methyltransferase domain-containing protein [Frankiaceae bacterium]